MPPFHPKVDIIVEEENNGVLCSLIIDLKLGPFFLVPEKIIRSKIKALIQPLIDEFNRILESESSLK